MVGYSIVYSFKWLFESKIKLKYLIFFLIELGDMLLLNSIYRYFSEKVKSQAVGTAVDNDCGAGHFSPLRISQIKRHESN